MSLLVAAARLQVISVIDPMIMQPVCGDEEGAQAGHQHAPVLRVPPAAHDQPQRPYLAQLRLSAAPNPQRLKYCYSRH